MKILILIAAIVLSSFATQKVNTVTIKFTVEEIQLVYDALGELPAKKVEQLRAKIVAEYQKQIADTTKKK